ncbi:collagen alpha-4(VI) chain-like isoform X2 [Lineus longissimus]|uniref:collagen alpha-4(VI) chain-like isoform X2 n=1 Tax=Lineus longissimus TaxID=88925 RepID=UPI00315CDD58
MSQLGTAFVLILLGTIAQIQSQNCGSSLGDRLSGNCTPTTPPSCQLQNNLNLVVKGCSPVVYLLNHTSPEDAAQGICVRQKLDLVFMMDESASIYPRQFKQQKDFVKQIVEGFEIGPEDTQIGLLTFGWGAKVRFNMNSYKRKSHVLQAIDYVRQRGGDTDTAEALRVVREYCFDDDHGSRAKSGDVRQVAVIITDGISLDGGKTIEAAKKTKEKGIIIITIGVGQKIKFEELEEVASRKDYVFAVDDYDELASLVSRIGPSACRPIQDQPQAPRGPTDPDAPGDQPQLPASHADSLGLPTRPLAVVASEAMTISTKGCENKVLDLFFILDVSLGYFDIRRMMGFVASTVYAMNVTGSKTRIGLITYSNNVHVYFELNENMDKQEVLQALRTVRRVPKRTRNAANVHEALKTVRAHLFDQKYGARKFAAKAVVLISDESEPDNGTFNEAAKIRELGATIFAFGVRHWVRAKDILPLVGLKTPEYMFLVDSYKKLADKRAQLNDMLCKVQAALGVEMDSCNKPNPVDLVFILDESSSIPYKSFVEEKDFMKNVVNQFKIAPKRSRVGLISYSTNATVQFYLDTHKTNAGVTSGVDELRRDGGDTSTWEALRVLRTFGFRDGVRHRNRRRRRRRHGEKPKIGIVITDGKSQRPWETAREALKVQKTGTILFAVGIGNNISFDELHSIASADDFVLTVDSFHDLRDIVDLVSILLCKVSHRQINIPLPGPPLDLRKETYKKGVDVVFVMDTKNAGQMDTSKVAKFAKKVVERFHIGIDGLQVSVIPCGWTAIPSFNLNTYQTKEEVINKLEMNLDHDLKTLLAKVAGRSFSADHGARPRGQARRIVVVITDEPVIDLDSVQKEAYNIKAQSAHVYVIGIGKMVRRRQLEMISSDPIGHYLIMLPNYKQLINDQSIYRHIAHAIYKEYSMRDNA